MSILYLLAAVSFAFMLEAMVARGGGQPSGRHLSENNNILPSHLIWRKHIARQNDHRYNPDEKERFSWIGAELLTIDPFCDRKYSLRFLKFRSLDPRCTHWVPA